MKRIDTRIGERVRVADLAPGRRVTLRAYVQQVRAFAWGGFLVLRLEP